MRTAVDHTRCQEGFGLLQSAPAAEQWLSQLWRFSADLHPVVMRIVLPRFFAQAPDAAAWSYIARQDEDRLGLEPSQGACSMAPFAAIPEEIGEQ